MMAEETKRRGLGRGLSSLLGEDKEDYAQLDKARSFKTVPVENLHPGRFQPRHVINDKQTEELAKSIADKGVLQPLLVRRDADRPGSFEIIAGERRWRAAQIAQVHEVPVVIKDITDAEALEIGLVENLQRQDLSPVDEALGYARLTKEFGHTQEDLARAVGKSRSHVANTMRLLDLPDAVKDMLNDGRLTAGHARALVGTPDPVAVARKVVRRGLNVRQTEKLANKKPRKKRSAAAKDADTLALERDMTNLLGLNLEINHRAHGGSLVIHYSTLDQLDDLLRRLSQGAENQPPARPGPRLVTTDRSMDPAVEMDQAMDRMSASLKESKTEAEPPPSPDTS